jgi:MFS family permease
MRTFFVIWSGQLVSTIGSGLTGFALGVWIYQQTGSTALFAIGLLAHAVPNLVVAPFAGALVDRWDRRKAMMFSDAGAGLCTLTIAALLISGRLDTPLQVNEPWIWIIYLLIALSASFSTFQWPAYSAATSLLVPKEQLGRAGGMVQIGEAVSQLIAPAVAGALVVTTGLQSVLLIDFATFLFAIFTLLLVRIPPPPASAAGQAQRGSLLKEAAFGWKYITARSGLFGLLMVFAFSNLLSNFLSPLITPLVLEMTTANVLGYLMSAVGVGMLAGTLVMSAWGGPRRRIHGVLGFLMISGAFMALIGLRPSLVLMGIAGFCAMFFSPIVNGSSQAIWQSKVEFDIQGRVFAIRRMIAWSTIPIAYLLAGPLADKVFRPLLVEGGPLADTIVGQVIGVGPSRGIGLMFVILGLLNMLVPLVGYLNPHVRNVEDELPDAAASVATAADVEPAAELVIAQAD